MKIQYLVLALSLTAVAVQADNSTVNAAIGGGIGGAAGAAIGNKVGGRDGAIVGGAIGGAIGTTIATENHNGHSSKDQSTTRHTDDEDTEFYDVRYAPPRYRALRGIPPGHLPPPGVCRIWYPRTPPGHQPPPGSCRELRHHVPRGAWLVRG